jgi:hypothetical protein
VLKDDGGTANGGQDASAPNTFTITVNAVNDAPVAANDSATTNEDTAKDIAVLSNDNDADGDTLSVSGFTQPAHGTVSDNGDGTLTYTPNANYNGGDTFTYTGNDGNGGTDEGAVDTTVNAVNDAPTLALKGGACLSDTAASGRLDFTVDDVDSLLSELALSATSDTPALIPNTNLEVGGNGTDTADRPSPSPPRPRRVAPRP